MTISEEETQQWHTAIKRATRNFNDAKAKKQLWWRQAKKKGKNSYEAEVAYPEARARYMKNRFRMREVKEGFEAAKEKAKKGKQR